MQRKGRERSSWIEKRSRPLRPRMLARWPTFGTSATRSPRKEPRMAEAFRRWQAEHNANMRRFGARYAIPTFEDAAVFDGWRVADVSDVAKLFGRSSPRVHALATLALWGDDPLWNVCHITPRPRFLKVCQ